MEILQRSPAGGGLVGKLPSPPVAGSDLENQHHLLPCLPIAAGSGKPWQLWDWDRETCVLDVALTVCWRLRKRSVMTPGLPWSANAVGEKYFECEILSSFNSCCAPWQHNYKGAFLCPAPSQFSTLGGIGEVDSAWLLCWAVLIENAHIPKWEGKCNLQQSPPPDINIQFCFKAVLYNKCLWQGGQIL